LGVIDRYECESPRGFMDMWQSPQGEYVKYTDAQARIVELEAALGAIANNSDTHESGGWAMRLAQDALEG
jgi:hypothetical protein